jgi:hypothetical protein
VLLLAKWMPCQQPQRVRRARRQAQRKTLHACVTSSATNH